MGKIKDITGMKFGRLTVIGLDEEKNKQMKKLKKRRTFWTCECECGNKTSVYGYSLKSGDTKSCGCYNKEAIHERCFKDLTGKRFGKLLVLELDNEKSNNDKKYYICECDCGNTVSVGAGNLTSETTKSCGCLKSETNRERNFNDLTGLTFGRLKVLELDKDNDKNRTHWICECECGNKVSVESTNLSTGHTQSCGCYRKEVIRDIKFKDLTGQKFGRLTVLYYDEEKSDYEKTMWVCECDCGNTKSVLSGNLVSGNSTSCGCYNRELCSGKNNPNWKGGTTEIKHYLRTHLTEWKKESLKHAGYKCCITGKNGKFNIHHTYPFQYIFDETMDELDMPIYEKIGEYTEEELDKILKLLLEKHFYYGYGAVVLEDIHLEFHNIYGRGGCGTIPPGEKEWKEFKNTYKITNN